jgi:hypothetical protein
MKLEGDYLYPETPEEAMAFLGMHGDRFLPSGMLWWRYDKIDVAFIAETFRFNQLLRISRTVARKTLCYQEGEPWCRLDDTEDLVVIGNWSAKRSIEFGNTYLHKRALYLLNNADEFRTLSGWLQA